MSTAVMLRCQTGLKQNSNQESSVKYSKKRTCSSISAPHASHSLKLGRILKRTAILAGRPSTTSQPLPVTSDKTQTWAHSTPRHSYPSTCTPYPAIHSNTRERVCVHWAVMNEQSQRGIFLSCECKSFAETSSSCFWETKKKQL